MRDDDGLVLRSIGEIVKEPRRCEVVSFDPETLRIGYHEVTATYEGPADRIYEVRLRSGRTVRVTAGHNLFALDADGAVRKVRTGELRPGAMVAVPRRVPEPPAAATTLRLLDAVPEHERARLFVTGPSVEDAFREHGAAASTLLQDAGLSASYYRGRGRLPWPIAAQLDGVLASLGPDDRWGRRTERDVLPTTVAVTADLAWTLGMFVAEGHRRTNQLTISNTQRDRLDRLARTFGALGLPVSRSAGAITCCSGLVSDLLGWLGTGGKAPTKRIPPVVFGWTDELVRHFLTGIIDGDGSVDHTRTSVRTTSAGLVSDLLLLFGRLGQRAGSTRKDQPTFPIWQVYAPHGEHKLLATVPLPDRLLVDCRRTAGLTQAEAARLAGYAHATDLNDIERRRGRDAVRRSTLDRLRTIYASQGARAALVHRLDRLVDGDLAWDRVVEVVDTGESEPIYDLEVRPGGRRIENFLAGEGGVFVSNTAGFIDPGFAGHITLELSNVANLPITLYPGMRVGQVSFLRMTTPADVPYGRGNLGSKYQGQRGPTPSRYFENFRRDPPGD